MSGNEPEVSVLLPMRNAGAFLERALTSILDQRDVRLEVVAIDDGSTDDTAEVFRRVADDRCELYAGPARGIAAALNLAAEHARGPFLARMDADDECRPDRLCRQAAALEADDRLVAVGSAYTVIDGKGRRVRDQAAPLDDLVTRGLLLSHNPFGHGSMMLRAHAFHAAGGYHADEEPAEDYGLWLRLAELGRFAAIADALYLHRAHDAQVSAEQSERQQAVARTLAATARRDLTIGPLDVDVVRHSCAEHLTAGEASGRLLVVAMHELTLELIRRRRWREAVTVGRVLARDARPRPSLRHSLRSAKAIAAGRRARGR